MAKQRITPARLCIRTYISSHPDVRVIDMQPRMATLTVTVPMLPWSRRQRVLVFGSSVIIGHGRRSIDIAI